MLLPGLLSLSAGTGLRDDVDIEACVSSSMAASLLLATEPRNLGSGPWGVGGVNEAGDVERTSLVRVKSSSSTSSAALGREDGKLGGIDVFTGETENPPVKSATALRSAGADTGGAAVGRRIRGLYSCSRS